MHSYILVDLTIKHTEKFDQYASAISPIVIKYGGRYIVKAAEPEIIRSSNDALQYMVVIEFPSAEKADGFLKERQDLGLADLFNQATVGRILKVAGCV